MSIKPIHPNQHISSDSDREEVSEKQSLANLINSIAKNIREEAKSLKGRATFTPEN